jgi:hypothetical protein
MMRLFIKSSLVLIVVVLGTAVAPSVKADPWVVETGGFWLNNLGNTGEVPNGLDSLVGHAGSNALDETGNFVATLNELSFTIGYTGEGSQGSQEFSFFQPLTLNGQTQMLEIFGTIEIGHEFDAVHLHSSTLLTYVFDTFTVDVNIIPMSMFGENGTYWDVLRADFVVNQNCDPVPEPATLTLLGLGLAGTAARIRQRRKRSRLKES